MKPEQKEKRSEIQKSLFLITRKFKKYEAWYLPECSYQPKN
jgi:hypothetical protein